MITKTSSHFQQQVLTQLSFTPHLFEDYTVYKNDACPELGFFIKYSREKYYEFTIGDYSIPHDFALCFNHEEELMRFGTVYMGETEFEIEDHPVSSFTPSSFLVIEKNLKGRQVWRKGKHYHGAEITIYKAYIDEIIRPLFPKSIHFDDFLSNHTYHYLPIGITTIIQTLLCASESNTLTPLYLESKILEALAHLYESFNFVSPNAFSSQINHGQVRIGENRFLTLTAADVRAIQKAHTILTEKVCHPPTIKNLSQMVFLNEQKLKAGFSAKYHMSIGEYTHSLRMAMAENLLCTTDLSIEEISKKIGYHHSSSFVKMFKKYHHKTPLAFRKQL